VGAPVCLFLIVRLSILLTLLTLVNPVIISLQDPVVEVHPGELQLCLFLIMRLSLRLTHLTLHG
jgi:hypothetical protein